VVFGRDLSAQSRMQQKLLETQQSMERDYAKLRQAETRYRLLFQLSADATLIVDSATGRVTEANPAAEQLFGRHSRRVIGRTLMDAFTTESRQAVQSLLASVRIAGRGDEVGAQLADSGREVTIAANSFRQDGASVLLVRLSLRAGDQPAGLSTAKAQMLKVAENLPDAFVITHQNGVVMSANGAFLDLVELGSEEQVRGESLERWLGGQGIEIEVLLSNLRNRGTVRLYNTTLRGAMGARVEVEISAVTVTHAGQEVYGFAIRDIGARVAAPRQAGAHATRSVEQLTELIGRVPLKDLVRDATDAIERLCIEAALQLSGDNRASAAEMLGLSRQSLYVKLHRYGLGDLGADSAEQG
jgi:transcriptional regulator PpsR